MGDSRPVVITVSLLPNVKVVERFFKLTLLEKKPTAMSKGYVKILYFILVLLLAVSSIPIRSSLSALSSYYDNNRQDNVEFKSNSLIPVVSLT